MNDQNDINVVEFKRKPWNKGQLVGQKPPLQSEHVLAIRIELQNSGRIRDLALFNLAIDNKLRGRDVVSPKVEDIAPYCYAIDHATIRQKKTGRPVKFEITEKPRQSLDTICVPPPRCQESFCLPVGAARNGAEQQVKMLAWYPSGSRASVWMPRCMARIRWDDRRQ